jgi:hypothetical protein
MLAGLLLCYAVRFLCSEYLYIVYTKKVDKYIYTHYLVFIEQVLFSLDWMAQCKMSEDIYLGLNLTALIYNTPSSWS